MRCLWLVFALFAPSVEATDSLNAVAQTVDILWVLLGVMLVFLMQAGFCLVETGCVRKKNTLNVALKNVADMLVCLLAYGAVGYGIMFGASVWGLFGGDGFWVDESLNGYQLAVFLFQAVFAGTAATIVSGAVAERMQFKGYLLVSVALALVIYPVVGHWVWNEGGWLASMGFVDFAGSTVVHGTGAWIALAGVMIMGARVDRFDAQGKPTKLYGHDLLLTTLGVFILWFGWFGFNGASTLGFTEKVPLVLVNTAFGAAAGGLLCLVMGAVVGDVIRVETVLNGVLGGLVGVTASTPWIGVWDAAMVGAVGGLVAHVTSYLILNVFKLDDPVSAISVHGFAGAWGTLAVALYAKDAFEGGVLVQWGVQLVGVFSVFVWSFVCGVLLFGLLKSFNMLRVPKEHEDAGLNVAEHDAHSVWLDSLQAMKAIAESGDLTRRVEIEVGTEAGAVAREFNRMVEQLSASIGELKVTSSSMNALSSDLLAFSGDNQQLVEAQKSSVDAIALSADSLKQELDRIDVSASDLAQTSSDAHAEMGSATQVISMASHAIDTMNASMKEVAGMIGELVSVSSVVASVTEAIGDIADQTNLLSLNAAIEAARAGESGRGFAVVAEEVRSLAQKTSQLTSDINSAIKNLDATTAEASKLIVDGNEKAEASQQTIQLAGMVFENIGASMEAMRELNKGLADTIRTQAQAVRSISDNLNQLEGIADSSANSSKMLSEKGQTIVYISSDVAGLISRYQVH